MKLENLILPLFLIIFFGYVLRRIPIFSDKFFDEANKLVYYITLPLILFVKTLNLTFKNVFSPALFFGLPLTMILTIVFSFILSFVMKRFQRGSFIQACFRGNLAYLGLSVASSIFSNDPSGIIAVLVGIGSIFNVVLSILILSFFDPNDKNRRAGIFQKIVINPLNISLFLGFLFSYLKITLPDLILNTILMISEIGLPLVLLLIGASLSFNLIKEYIIYDVFSAAIKLVIMPLFAYFVMVHLFSATDVIVKNTIIMAAMPTATISYTFAKEYSSDDKLAASIVTFSTTLSMVTIPIILHYLIF